MTFDPNFDPIEGARIERVESPMDEGNAEADQVDVLREHLYVDSRGILGQVDSLIAGARGSADAVRVLSEAQDGLIHAIIDVHTLIHLELGKAQG